METSKLIALAGYAGVGKDEAAKALIQAGYTRVAFGDIIKRQVDALVKQHLGFSAFTEDRTQKPLIRRTLESWGEDNYDQIMREFFESLPERAVNTRLVRVREATEWVRRGGIIIRIDRPGVGPATEWEEARLTELKREGLIHWTIHNGASPQWLHREVLKFAEQEGVCATR